ncbi:helix-turn-helix domain-containing protein [Streptomyces sp. SP18BB07]|uniref:helix-turn-helix domain-containing protein n=1 Tax=Streptomyces sp. SP18BB07 TaxID=3002522 RepID=UPI002E7A73E7|nr:XRE family transcriptional regulator [Streptomyces sp. SP18BB07]MEE1763559.1 XRE family transcriptional regulator [Streptomyces sp. SP18BB07]
MSTEQPTLPGVDHADLHDLNRGFEAARLTQARHLAGLTKKQVADAIGVTAAAVGQYETGSNKPRPELIGRLATVLDVPATFFLAGRAIGTLNASMAHFRALRSTSGAQRNRALGFAGQVWELTHALEKRVQLPLVNLPGFAGGEVHPGTELPAEPIAAARALRQHWALGQGPMGHLVRRMESHGIVVVSPPVDDALSKVDAFASAGLPRPLAVITANRADDVYRYRFSAAHELGHLVLHATATGDAQQEREADTFAAEFLTPRNSILPVLPRRLDFAQLATLSRTWGVSVHSLVYRCRELGLISDSTASRAYQRLRGLRQQPGFSPEPVSHFPGEQPIMLRSAFELADQDTGLTIRDLARELAWKPARVRELLGLPDTRPVLRLV